AGQEQGFVTPGVLALAAALLTIVVKAFMYRWTIRVARQINSTSLRASALDHRSDVIASAGTFFGIAATRFGFPSMDTIASVLISGLIVRTAYDIARQSFDQMLDRACPPDVEEALHQVVERQHGVRTVDRLTTRQFGPRYYVDVSIACDSDLTIGAGHEIANQVHDEIEKNFPDVKHCMVHVNPYRRRPDGPGTVQ
ncbi:MAG: cation diffusion facilitator family transporter, partial [Oscillospiraceae bacterium]